MAGFLYFIANVTEADLNKNGLLDRAILKAKGLDDVLSDVVQVPAHASLAEVKRLVGPGGNVGVVLAPVSKHYGVPELVTFDPDRQKWFDRGNGVWIGITTADDPPNAQGLERWTVIPGTIVADEQTQQWKIPIARWPSAGLEYGTLPQTYTFDDDGKPLAKVQSKYAYIWQLAGQVRDFFFTLHNAPDDNSTPEERANYKAPEFDWLVIQAAIILGFNYRLGLKEINVLASLGRDILTQTTVTAICQSIYGMEVFEIAKKKPLDCDSNRQVVS
ncbi:MAG: hypothetical protein ACO1RA_02305 [Planctomycetaceae bacterium]